MCKASSLQLLQTASVLNAKLGMRVQELSKRCSQKAQIHAMKGVEGADPQDFVQPKSIWLSEFARLMASHQDADLKQVDIEWNLDSRI